MKKNSKKKPSLKKYSVGGFLGNMVKGGADAALGTLGLGNVISDSAYNDDYGNGAKFFKGYANTFGTLGRAALPMAGQLIGIPAPITAGVQNQLSQIGNNYMHGGTYNEPCYECGDLDEYKSGGSHWIQKAIKHPGRCSNPGDARCPKGSPQYNLAMTFKKHHGFHKKEYGGIHEGMPNAEVEKQEMMRFPNGMTYQVDGASHAQGGIDVNIPDGTQIFSDKLKVPGTKLTFAKQAEKYKTNKQKKVGEDNKATGLSKSTAKLVNSFKQKKLDELFSIQESLKMDKMNRYAKRLGLNNNNFAYGGTKYQNGGIEDDGLDDNGQAMSIIQGNFDREFSNLPSQQMQQNNQTSGNNFSGIDYAMAAANLLGPAYSLLTNKKENTQYINTPPKSFTYNLPDYKEYDPTSELNEADRQNRVVRNMARNYAGGNSAAYLSTLPMVQSNLAANKQAVLNKAQNINTQYYNQLQPTIANIKNRNIDAQREGQYRYQDMQNKNIDLQMQNEARYRDINRQSFNNLGTNLSGVLRDIKLGKGDAKSIQLISSMFPDYNFDPNTNTWVNKTTGQTLK